MRVLVCGGRHYKDKKRLFSELESLNPKPTLIIQGGATGADKIAKSWAKSKSIEVAEINPDWDKYGKRAGPIRNQDMINKHKPDLCIAFKGGRGTADMIRRCEVNDIPVKDFSS